MLLLIGYWKCNPFQVQFIGAKLGTSIDYMRISFFSTVRTISILKTRDWINMIFLLLIIKHIDVLNELLYSLILAKLLQFYGIFCGCVEVHFEFIGQWTIFVITLSIWIYHMLEHKSYMMDFIFLKIIIIHFPIL